MGLVVVGLVVGEALASSGEHGADYSAPVRESSQRASCRVRVGNSSQWWGIFPSADACGPRPSAEYSPIAVYLARAHGAFPPVFPRVAVSGIMVDIMLHVLA